MKGNRNLRACLNLLGPEVLAKSVVASYVKEFFDQSAQAYSLCMSRIYHHAVGKAKTAEQLSSRTQTVSSARAYTGGLLHDIGRVVLEQHVATGFPLFYRRRLISF